MPRITFQKETTKELPRQLREANALGDVRLVRRIVVLLAIARGEGLSQVEEQRAISHQTVYNRLAGSNVKPSFSLLPRPPPPEIAQSQSP